MYRKDRTQNGGGVFIATKDCLITAEEPDFGNDSEIIWASLQFKSSKPLLIASFYRPPGNNAQPLDALQSSFAKAMKNSRRYANIIIGGDFNLGDINWKNWTTTKASTRVIHQKFLDFLLNNTLSQLVDKITRPISNSILDLIVTSNPNIIENIEVLPGMSDHCLVTFDINMKPKTQRKPQRKIHLYKKCDHELIKTKVKEFVDDFLASKPEDKSVNTNWMSIRDGIASIVNKHVPSKLSKSRHNLPWITAEVKRKLRKRDRKFKKARISSSSADWKAYRSYRNYVTKYIRQCHQGYVNNVIGESLIDNPKSFWSYIRMHKTENIGIPTLKTPNKMCNYDYDKAQALNSHFESVFNKKTNQGIPDKGKSPYPSISHLQISIDGVAKQLQNLNPSKASGPDEMSPRVLNMVANEIAPALRFLFQQSYDQQTVPDQWRQAMVSAIHKGGQKADPSNYRPISLTCICCKIMEHIVLSHIAKHLNTNSILINNQHGFREHLSTVTQLINSTNDWAKTLNTRGQTDVILLDFSKAFDKVSHPHLSAKLNHYGIRDNTLEWINSFLSNRKQSVSVNGTHSSWVNVTSGVPQGSVLGPVLFLLYINDINDHIQSTIKLFADDSILYREIQNPQDLAILQADLNTLADWADNWLMSFNVKKCAILSITRKRSPLIHTYTLREECLNRVKKHDYLGVTVSDDLNWNDHCSKVSAKASRTLGLLRRTLSPCSKRVKSRAYQTLVRPQLEYASEVWCPNTATQVKRIEQVQLSAARFVMSDYRRETHVSQMVQQLNWDLLHTRRLVQISCMMYKIQYGLVNITTPPCFIRASHISPRLDHPLKYVNTHIPTINVYKYSYFPRAVSIWNRLPPAAVLHINPSPSSFHSAAAPAIR